MGGAYLGDTSLKVDDITKLLALVDSGLIGTTEIANAAITEAKSIILGRYIKMRFKAEM